MEAWGLRLGLHLIQEHVPTHCRTQVQGDCVPVIRYGCGQGRLIRAASQAVLGRPLLEAALRVAPLGWLPVPRRFTAAAHHQAAAGLAAAAAEASSTAAAAEPTRGRSWPTRAPTPEPTLMEPTP